ncbi:UNVERIFIED_CONTAM: hypothetical protein RMT77_002080 [Armadillidium vulgare]
MSSPVRLQRPSNLALEATKPKSRVTFKEESLVSQTRSTSNNNPSPRKLKCDGPDCRTKRKRTSSCSFSWDHFNNKRRKPAGAIVLPTKFLLGGNITDPLNLEALDKEEIENKPAEEPNSGNCRRGSTVRVIIPPNINDPLNLDACSEDGEEQLADAISRQRRRRKTKKRKRRNSEPGGFNTVADIQRRRLCISLDDSETPRKRLELETPPIVASIKDIIENAKKTTTGSLDDAKNLSSNSQSVDAAAVTQEHPSTLTNEKNDSTAEKDLKKDSPITSTSQGSAPSANSRHIQLKRQRSKTENKIVSPVVPQPGVERKRHFSYTRYPSSDKGSNPSQSHLNPPKRFNQKNQRFQYGNYNQYYGYRNAGHKADPRLKCLDKEWFRGKEVLDIGCNIGHITLTVARDFAPRRIVGIDIDKKLVNIAQKNVYHYVTRMREEEDEYPASMKMLYGPLKPPLNEGGERKFPHNVKFYQSNYVLENDALLDIVAPEFDVILCLSVTKWVHLNWGDSGLKRFFKRIFRNLKPGGIFILEPQSWRSYTKKRKLTNEIFENYKNIKFFPNQIGEFLTSEVGFSFLQKCSVSHLSRGFERPIYIYKKASQEVKISVRGSNNSEEFKQQQPDNVASQRDENKCVVNSTITVKEECELPSTSSNCSSESLVTVNDTEVKNTDNENKEKSCDSIPQEKSGNENLSCPIVRAVKSSSEKLNIEKVEVSEPR